MSLLFPTHYPVACHTDNITAGSTFVAIRGQKEDGALFIASAIAKGATHIVLQEDTVLPPDVTMLMREHKVTHEYVCDTRLALAQLSAQMAGYPAQKLKIIGITGTKGKTTTSFLLEHILRSAGKKTALTGTVKNRIDGYDLSAPLTTPQPDYLHQFLKLCVDHGVEYVIMEVAAQALTLHRVHGIQFDGIIFTNFSHEHLEFYATMADYFAAKKLIFAQAKPDAPLLINADDQTCHVLSAAYAHAITFGLRPSAAIVGKSMAAANGLVMQMHVHAQSFTISNAHLMGGFNLYNMLAAVGMAYKLGIALTAIQEAVSSFVGVPGRLERHVLKNGASCVIDYAHNPSSYEAVLSLLKSQTNHLIVIFGAGGGRDKLKRPIMGAIAAQYADYILLTSDNPRYEDPQAIVADILAGINPEQHDKVAIQLDRQQAIYQAYALSKPGTIIAILGKGPDEYQIVCGVKTPFSEARIIARLHEIEAEELWLFDSKNKTILEGIQEALKQKADREINLDDFDL